MPGSFPIEPTVFGLDWAGPAGLASVFNVPQIVFLSLVFVALRQHKFSRPTERESGDDAPFDAPKLVDPAVQGRTCSRQKQQLTAVLSLFVLQYSTVWVSLLLFLQWQSPHTVFYNLAPLHTVINTTQSHNNLVFNGWLPCGNTKWQGSNPDLFG